MIFDMKATSFCCLFFLILSSCTPDSYKTDILGSWKQVQWTIVESGQPIDQAMDFTFSADERYEVDYRTEKEAGKYWLSGDDLYTKEDDRVEKKVKIMTLTPDSLVFEMNRAGRLEEVVLVKE